MLVQPVHKRVLGNLALTLTKCTFQCIKTKKSVNNMANACCQAQTHYYLIHEIYFTTSFLFFHFFFFFGKVILSHSNAHSFDDLQAINIVTHLVSN